MAQAVVFTEQFKRALKAKTPDERKRVKAAIARLLENPHRKGTHRVRGTVGVWEARINGGNRLTFCRHDGRIVMLNNCHHDRVLKYPGSPPAR